MREEFVNSAVFDKDLPFYISLAGTSYCDGSYKITRNCSAVGCVEYIISGCGNVKANGKEYIARAGDTYILFPDDDHLYYSDSDFPWTKIWFNASGKLFNTLASIYSLRNQTVFHCDTQKYIKKIHAELARKDITPMQIANSTALIFHEMIQFLHTNGNNCGTAISDAKKIKNYIDLHLFEPMRLNNISSQIYKSTAQTIRIFKKAYGITPYEYYLNSKIEKAVEMLENSTFSVKETAFRLGFCDEHYFSNLFRKKTGKTPLEFSRKH